MQAHPPAELFDRNLARIRRERALRAGTFDSFLHDRIAGDLAERLASVTRNFATIAVLGTAAARNARVFTGVQPSARIITGSECRNDPGAQLVFDLAAPPFAPASLECIICILGLEQVNDLAGTLIQLRQALKPDGLLLAAMIGGESLKELRSAWLEAESETRGGVSPRVAPFTTLRDAGALIQRAGFALPVADCDRITLTYADPFSAMREVKALGWSNSLAGRCRNTVSRQLALRAAGSYHSGHAGADGRVPLTLDVIHMAGWAPDASQPKPLKPGSARIRLADALGTREHTLKDD